MKDIFMTRMIRHWGQSLFLLSIHSKKMFLTTNGEVKN